MATTENIGLKLFEGSDFVSREDINANYEAIDANLGIDHVIERGKYGDWEWVKYSSGFMEQWISDKAFATQTTQAWGSSSLSRTPAMKFPNFPIAFTSMPLCFVTFNSADRAGLESIVGYGQGVSTTMPPEFFLADCAAAGTVLSGLHFGIYARGYWK